MLKEETKLEDLYYLISRLTGILYIVNYYNNRNSLVYRERLDI